MPTITKTDTNGNSVSEIISKIISMISTFPGVETEHINTDVYHIYFDGNKNTAIHISDPGQVASYTTNIQLKLLQKNGESYSEVLSRAIIVNLWDTAHPSVWIREYVSSNSEKDRLITISTGVVGRTGGNVVGYGNGYDGCIMVGEDSVGNTVYGLGTAGIQLLYCPQASASCDLTNMSFNTSVNDVSNSPVPILADKAYITKAVNLCHPNLPEMKNIYTAIFRPISMNGSLAAQRYYISGNMWGTIGSDQLFQKCNYFDPMVKI